MEPKPLSARTLAEQKAGREAIFEAVKAELLKNGDATLARKFPTYIRSSTMVNDPLTEEWVVIVNMQTHDGSIVELSDRYMFFPSDELIATMMLLKP